VIEMRFLNGCAEIAAMGFGAFDDESFAPAERAPLSEHLAGCAGCRTEAQALRGLASRLTREARRDDAGAALLPGDRGVRRRSELLEAWQIGRAERRTWLPALPIAAALLVGLLLGIASPWRPWMAVHDELTAPAELQDTGSREFLLALSERPGSIGGDPAELRAIVDESVAWANDLAAKSLLVSAEKLRDDTDVLLRRDGGGAGDGIRVLPRPDDDAAPSVERLSGYFVIRARDVDHAIELARESPHLRHGGTIALREIEKGD
jgi:hypothetical protein